MTLSRRMALGLAGAALLAPAARAATALVCGAALPLSGGAALLGNEILRGIQLAADVVNAAGGIAGKPVPFFAADMPAPADATGVVNGLINASHAGVMFGSGDSAL